jgi:hypothetical protein
VKRGALTTRDQPWRLPLVSESYSTEFLQRLYELYPELVDFDPATGERGLFKEVLEGLWAVLPGMLRTPLAVGSLLTRALHNPEDPGAVVLHAYMEFGPHHCGRK